MTACKQRDLHNLIIKVEKQCLSFKTIEFDGAFLFTVANENGVCCIF